jgi:NTE family protein
MSQKKKIGLILSGGGMHGFAELGALKVLEELNIKPDLIVGCSVGSLVGAAMAAGSSAKEIEDAVLKTNLFKLIQPTMGQGLVRGERIVHFILHLIKAEKFEDLKTKLIINATNISKGEEVIFEKGHLLTPLNASISIPGFFAPVLHDGDLLVDGGFYDSAPIHHAKKMDIIIIIDVSNLNFGIHPKSGIIDIFQQSIVNLQQRIVQLNLDTYSRTHEIIIISPDVSKFSLFEYKKERQKEMIKIGEAEARKVLSDMRAKRILGIE